MHEDRSPTSGDARVIVRTVLDCDIRSIKRFSSGLCHYVYDVVTVDGEKFVIRIAHPADRSTLAGSVYWSGWLRPRGVPLPKLVHADLERTISPLQFVILERLPGTDLGRVYAQLSLRQKQELATNLTHMQAIMSLLPRGNGFGPVFAYDGGFPHRGWEDFIASLITRSRARLSEMSAGVLPSVDLVEDTMRSLVSYFDSVEPIAFLDDITTKNVIVYRGVLSGIVDVDSVCFGDSLLTIGLTQAALLERGLDLDYIRAWTDLMNLNRSQARALWFYTMLFCVDFMSEVGQTYNREGPLYVGPQRLRRLENTLEALLSCGPPGVSGRG